MFPHAQLEKLSWIITQKAVLNSASMCEKKAGNACRVQYIH